MKTFLVPTDFSACADNSFAYAIDLCGTLGGRITMFHAYQVPVVNGTVPADLISETAEVLDKQWLQKLEVYKSRGATMGIAKYDKGIDVDTRTDSGFTVEAILSSSRELNPNMIVMGTKGVTDLVDRVLGSIASGVITRSHVPVVVVPEQAEFEGIKHILYATDFDEVDRVWLKDLVEFARHFDARITCLHITKDGSSSEEIRMGDLESRLWIEEETSDIKFDIIPGVDVEHGLMEYARSHNANLIALLSHRRSFVERLFHKSFTKKMTLHSHIPLLVFPEK